MEYVRGHWQRPTWQGRFAGSGAAGAADDGLIIAWLLLERAPEPGGPSPAPPADDGALRRFGIQAHDWGLAGVGLLLRACCPSTRLCLVVVV